MMGGQPVVDTFREIWNDARGWGIFRPVYWVWVVLGYGVFRDVPVGMYLLVTLMNFLAMMLWGEVFYRYYGRKSHGHTAAVFLFPLLFFVFTPFWSVFMYLSLQEKFIILFSPLALLSFHGIYESKRPQFHLIAALVWALLALLAKPTGVYLFMVFGLFALCDIVIWHMERKRSMVVFASTGLIFMLYVFFSFAVQLKGKYTARYANSLMPGLLLERMADSPMVIKVMAVIALVAGIYWFLRGLIAEDKRPYTFGVLIPWGLLAYIGLLLPWGFPSYLLCVFAPFLLGIFYPVYQWLCSSNSVLKTTAHVGMAILITATMVGVVQPRISRMADIGLVERHMIDAGAATPGMYFMTSYEESALTLQAYTGEHVVFLPTAVLSGDMLKAEGFSYIILNDLCAPVTLENVRVDEIVYENRTWVVARVVPDDGGERVFCPKFRRTPLETLAKCLREM